MQENSNDDGAWNLGGKEEEMRIQEGEGSGVKKTCALNCISSLYPKKSLTLLMFTFL